MLIKDNLLEKRMSRIRKPKDVDYWEEHDVNKRLVDCEHIIQMNDGNVEGNNCRMDGEFYSIIVMKGDMTNLKIFRGN